MLDVENDFSENYILEVSSPGLDRKFFYEDQYQDYLGEELKVSFFDTCLLYTSPSPRDGIGSRMPSSA